MSQPLSSRPNDVFEMFEFHANSWREAYTFSGHHKYDFSTHVCANFSGLLVQIWIKAIKFHKNALKCLEYIKGVWENLEFLPGALDGTCDLQKKEPRPSDKTECRFPPWTHSRVTRIPKPWSFPRHATGYKAVPSGHFSKGLNFLTRHIYGI